MAKVFNLSQAQSSVGFQREALYNALDTIATLEIDNVLEARMDERDQRTHDFYMAMQGPALDMTVRGIRVNEQNRGQLVSDLQKELRRVEGDIARNPQIRPIWDKAEKNTGACNAPSRKDGKHKWEPGVPDGPDRKCVDCGVSRMKIRPFKAGSDDDLKHLFYDLWKLKPIHDKDGKVTTSKEAREKLRNKHPKFEATLGMIDEYANLKKQLGFLKFHAPDGRFHSSFNVGVTSTHRWSSNKDAFGRGGNAQNITEAHRFILEADEGYEIVYADLKQAESNVIAHVAGDKEYINAHLIGDTHTYVCRLVWSEGINGQKWTGDIAQDKKIATSARPSWDDKDGHDYRFQSKAVQHGSNLGLTPFGLAIQKRIPVNVARDSQRRYFEAFPGIREYQQMIRTTVQEQQPIITPLGMKFLLFGRPWDEHTYKEGLAVIPQSTVGHIISIGAYKIWRTIPKAKLLAQVHDALLLMIPKGDKLTLWQIIQAMSIRVPIVGVDGILRTTEIEVEVATGKNWGHFNDNPAKGRLNLEGVKEVNLVQLEKEIREHSV